MIDIHPEQAEHNGKYAQPIKQADTQFAHGVTRSLLAQVCPKTGENSQFSHGNAVLCMAGCAILQSIRPVMAEDWFLPAFCVRAIIWYCVQLCAHGWKIPAHGAEMQPEMLGGDSYFQYEEDQPLRQRTPCCAQRPEGEYEQQPPGTSACPPVRTGTGGAAGIP